jgi:predicted CxxxxCH...CXXCH cytochrome family protein
VPATVTDPGHLAPAPAVVDASLGWDRDVETCATAYCHGSGRPHWTSQGEVFCGSCHGIPPADAPHTPAMTLTSCVACHAGSVDAFGGIVAGGKHLDGVVDHQ